MKSSLVLRLCTAATAALTISACAAQPPTVSTAPPASTQATASPSEPPQTPAEESPSASPSAPASTSTSDAPANAVVLDGKSVAGFPFGTPEKEVEAVLIARMGTPDDDYQGKICELLPDSQWSRTLSWSGAWVTFESARNKGKTAPRKLTGWGTSVSVPLKSPMALGPNTPLEITFPQLKKKFPKGTLKGGPFGEEELWYFNTPSGVWYRGDNKVHPDVIGAGPQHACE